MGLFSNFVERRMAAKLDKVAAKMEQAGAQAVSIATELVPVKTGQLQASISYIFKRSDMSLRLIADRPYARVVERRKPYLGPAIASIRRQFGIKDASAYFPNTPGVDRPTGGLKPVQVGTRKLTRR